MPWYNPFSWFKKNAAIIQNSTNSATLSDALKNYINAVNKLNNKNNAHIYGALMKTKNGTNSSYKNRIVNGIAKIVVASRRALPAAANAAAGVTPIGPAVAAVNNATAELAKLNAMAVRPPVPEPVGLGGAMYGATRRSNNNTTVSSKINRNYVNTLLSRSNLNTNNKKINAIISYNPKLKYTTLITNANNTNFKRLMTAVNAKLNANGGKLRVNTTNNVNINASNMINENKLKRQANINAALSEINAAKNNMNKLRGIQTRLTNMGFNTTKASANAVVKYKSMTNRLAANKAITNANAITSNSNKATIEAALSNLRNVQGRVSNNLRTRVTGKIGNLERVLLLKNSEN